MPEAAIYGSREERVIIATATPENHERISAIVRDFESGFTESETRVFPIGKGNATSLRQAIQEMSPEIKVAADAASNSLIVTASREDLDRISTIVEEVELGGDKARETRFLAVLHADPLPLAKALKDSFPKAEFSADSISGGIFATASSEDHEAISKVLESLNKQPTKLPTLKAFVLKNAAPEVVAAAMESAFGRRGSVGISFSRETKSVFVVGSNQELQIASQLVEQLDVDQSQSSLRTMRAFTLNGADGKSVAESIENLFKDSAAKVEVSHDLLNEQLYVTGSAAQLRSVEESLKQFTPPKRELEIIQLDSTIPTHSKSQPKHFLMTNPQIAPRKLLSTATCNRFSCGQPESNLTVFANC